MKSVHEKKGSNVQQVDNLRGRLLLIQRLFSPQAHSVSVGSGWAPFGGITVDIRKETYPDIVGDALRLPIKSSAVDQVLFTDVIEHLPEGTEVAALKEIRRILTPKGRVLVSTPNNVALFKTFDPERYVRRHRHYSTKALVGLVRESGLRVEKQFESGFVFVMLKVLWYTVFVFPISHLLGATLPEAPGFLLKRETREYSASRTRGYTIFLIAIRP